MGQVHPMPNQSEDLAVPAADNPPATIRSIDSAHCGLCGAKLSARALRYHVVSPQCCESTITVCRTCRKAALGEGYRPAE
jgi:predicted RNA-binding Zn-ribbon protein involved in translation (DUF1610 family)